MLLLARLPAAASDWMAGPAVSLSPRIGAMISPVTAWPRITGRHRVCEKPVSIRKLMRQSMVSKVRSSILVNRGRWSFGVSRGLPLSACIPQCPDLSRNTRNLDGGEELKGAVHDAMFAACCGGCSRSGPTGSHNVSTGSSTEPRGPCIDGTSWGADPADVAMCGGALSRDVADHEDRLLRIARSSIGRRQQFRSHQMPPRSSHLFRALRVSSREGRFDSIKAVAASSVNRLRFGIRELLKIAEAPCVS